MADDLTTGSPLPAPRAGLSGARAHLECKAGPEKGQTFRVAPTVTVIGRDPSCDVHITEPAVSRQHCRIERTAEGWVLRNLSANGTRIRRQEIEEHVLADGDEIRIGAKTRLVFVVEEVAVPAVGRPQFRPRRPGRPVEEEETAESRPTEETEEEAPSLFRRRRGLFIGLAIYLGAIVIGGAVAAVYLKGGGGGRRSGEPPLLDREERILPAGGTQPLRIDHTSAAGIWCVDERGQQVLVPHEDLATGRARRVPGIRQAIDVEYLTRAEFERRRAKGEIPPDYPYVLDAPRSRHRAEQLKRLAIETYLVSDLPGNEGKLLTAVRLFQKALAHYGMRFLPDHTEERIRQQAIKKLIDKVYDLYTQAVLFERAGNYVQAQANYTKLLEYVPEPDNIIYKNVSRRLTALRRRMKEERRRR